MTIESAKTKVAFASRPGGGGRAGMLGDRLRRRPARGFTLIEIVMVIVILGLLSAIAVPKFFAMQQAARQAVINEALAEAAGRFHHAYSRYILDRFEAPGGVDGFLDRAEYLGEGAGDNARGVVVGDFTVIWSRGAQDDLVIEVVAARTIRDMDGLTTRRVIGSVQWGS